MKHLIATVCFAAILSFGAGMLEAQDANVITAAKREGRVVWYSVAGESQQLAQEFEKKYPFVKVEVIRSTVYPLLLASSTKPGQETIYLTLCASQPLPSVYSLKRA